MKLFSAGGLAHEAYLAILLLGGYSYICNVASNNDNGPVAALERPLPLLYAQRLSTTLNVEATNDIETR